jgi:hypothetical protein
MIQFVYGIDLSSIRTFLFSTVYCKNKVLDNCKGSFMVNPRHILVERADDQIKEGETGVSFD